MAAVDPYPLVASALAGRRPVPVRVVAVGKAAPRMAAAAVSTLGALVRDGVVVSPEGTAVGAFAAVRGGHPVPAAGSEEAGRRALAIASALGADERLLVLLSGGASALMAAPAAGLTLADKQSTTERLLRAGADIHALNVVRKHLSLMKGGRLAAACAGRCDTLAVSDVVGDDLSVIGSGPGVPDPSTFADALGVLGRHGGEASYPSSVVRHLRAGAAGEIEDTPKPGDPRVSGSTATVIAGRATAMAGAATEAARLGYHVLVRQEPVVGEARRSAAEFVADVGLRLAGLPRPCCLIASGETTVHVVGSGTGGRNQEFVLAAAPRLAPLGAGAVLASVGTDGIDGPTDAAGALVDSTTLARAEAAGLDLGRHLEQNDAYAALAALGDLIKTGLTGTNVGDLQLVLLA